MWTKSFITLASGLILESSQKLDELARCQSYKNITPILAFSRVKIPWLITAVFKFAIMNQLHTPINLLPFCGNYHRIIVL
jgi:hypothetical protein